jgi:uncharacterized protein (TIGR03435 family)
MRRIALLAILRSVAGLAQPRFEVASIKRSPSTTGGDGDVTLEPARFAARNTTLKRLLFEAWQIPYSQISGPAWINTDEFEVDARSAAPLPTAQLRAMLRSLLIERFQLQTRTGDREQRAYILTTDRGGARVGARVNAPPREGPRVERFHGDLAEFANILAIRLTIPIANANTPSIPSRAAGTPIPVLNRTGIEGVYDLAVELQLDQSNDAFTLWQRALREQLGLRLDSGRAAVPFLTVLTATRTPASN